VERGRVGRVARAPEDALVTASTRNTAGVCVARAMSRLCPLLAWCSVPAAGSLCLCGHFSLWSAHTLATRAAFIVRFLARFSGLLFIPIPSLTWLIQASNLQQGPIPLLRGTLPSRHHLFLSFAQRVPAAVRPIHEYDLPLSSRMRRPHLCLLLLLVRINRHACRDRPTPRPRLHLCNRLLPTNCRPPGSCFVWSEASVARLGRLPRAGCSRPSMLSVVQRHVSGGLALQRRALHEL